METSSQTIHGFEEHFSKLPFILRITGNHSKIGKFKILF